MSDANLEATVQAWFAQAYEDSAPRVLRSVPRTRGRLFEIERSDRRCWLRIGGTLGRSPLEVEAEGRVAAQLADAGISVVRPVSRADGAFAGLIVMDGVPATAIAYEEAPGDHVDTLTEHQARRLGHAVGRLHCSGVGEEGLPVVEPLATAMTCLDASAPWLDPDDEQWLRATVDRQLSTVERLGWSTRHVICHGDLRIANVMFLDEAPTLFDLEALGLGPGMYDCACLWRRCVLENDVSVPRAWAFFKQGYASVTPVGEDPWRVVPPLAVLRALWTMSLPALPGANWGQDWVRDRDYWRAHVSMLRWFAAVADRELRGE